jgi:hypothetical protein
MARLYSLLSTATEIRMDTIWATALVLVMLRFGVGFKASVPRMCPNSYAGPYAISSTG